MDAGTKEKIEGLLNSNKVVLFMKGTPSFPMCGFSARAVAILQECQTEFASCNVLDDEEVRAGIKEYGNWPTIPQLYINKELVGGSDIMIEMFQSGELKTLLDK
ncbi:MAG: Grx4 family monothiol glutaredoxin [Bdellovibrionaceae bacterium]|nr:Grx4 family monothiol glutaredoxin [Bdellovibrionales bacterium]MCB9084508.1 Grx4 family monothiol glutaredoxin [Pseudobdellovibrionaceae bacterium]